MDMKPLIDLLAIDERIRGFEQEVTDIPLRKEQEDQRLGTERNRLAQAHKDLQEVQARVDELELEIKTRQKQIEKLRQQQMVLKSNKEFKAMEKEIALVERQIDETESRLLEAMDAVGPADARVAEREKDYNAEKTAFSDFEQQLDERLASAKEHLAVEIERRGRAVEQAPPKALKVYERIKKNKWPPLVRLEEGGVCGGCHMNQPPAIQHAARRADELVMCQFCGRMLYAKSF